MYSILYSIYSRITKSFVYTLKIAHFIFIKIKINNSKTTISFIFFLSTPKLTLVLLST